MKKISPVNFIFASIVILLVGAAFIIGVLWTKVSYLEKQTKAGLPTNAPVPSGIPPNVKGAATGKIKPVSESDHLRGDKNAKVFLVEYSDFECSFCKSFHQTLNQLLAQYPEKVALIYRHFPLDQIHSKARKEAQATECAAELGGNEAFWKLADKIFAVTPSNNGLNLDDLPVLASQTGLDANRFKTCLSSDKYAKLVEDNYQDGVQAGVNGTPATFLINPKGDIKLLPGAVPFETLKQAVDQALKN